MDLEESVHAHAEWKLKFRAAISKQEQMDAPTIAKDNCCTLGKWLYGEGKSSMGDRQEFRRSLEAHRDFHVEAGKVAALINARKYPEAEGALGAESPYTSASSKVSLALRALKRAAL